MFYFPEEQRSPVFPTRLLTMQSWSNPASPLCVLFSPRGFICQDGKKTWKAQTKTPQHQLQKETTELMTVFNDWALYWILGTNSSL